MYSNNRNRFQSLLRVSIESAKAEWTKSIEDGCAFDPIKPIRIIRLAVGPSPPLISTKFLQKKKK